MKRCSFLRALAAAVLLGSACSDSSGPDGDDVTTVTMNSSTFSPSDVTISVGESVRWVNGQAIAHTITPANPQQAGVWAAQNVPATTGFAFQARMNTAGTFNYSCTLHAGMTGRVIVQ